jgi:hypothetical protein
MHQKLEAVCVALDKLAESIVNVWGDDRTYNEAFGWSGPALNRHELASVAYALASDIRETQADTIPEAMTGFINDLPRRINVLQTSTVPQFPGGNMGQAIPAYLATLQFVRVQLLPALGWVAIPDEKLLPHKLLRRARAASSQLEESTTVLEGLDQKVQEILSAHAAAISLPADLQDLKDAKEEVASAVRKSLSAQTEAETHKGVASTDAAAIRIMREEAAKLVENCEDAYRITTSKGLAGAFQERANRLAWSMWVWVVGLVIALVCAYLVGGKAVDLFMRVLEGDQPKGATLQATLTALGVFAPLWFAWISTKQIGERFRLSEDYAFKASVSKAYEGYRREAANLDEAFAARLFSSALTRLDEAPLRLVETENHGSPWHELIKGIFSSRAKPVASSAVSVERHDAGQEGSTKN